MNHKQVITTFLFISFLSPSTVLAETSLNTSLSTSVELTTPTSAPSPTSKPWLFGQIRQLRKDVREEVRENRQDVRQDVKEIRKEIKNTPIIDRLEGRKKILTTSQNGLFNSFKVRASALERYQKMIVDRIAQKLVKFPGNQDLIKAQASLTGDEQKTLWANFSASIAKYEASIKLIANSDNPKSLLPDLRAQAKKVHEDLKALRQMLVVNLRLTVRAK
jgi:hypothetical protein